MNLSNLLKNGKRLFAPAIKEAIYTMETAPDKVKLDKFKDILHLHWNDGPYGEKITNGVATAMKRFNNADHGVVARLGDEVGDAGYGLSHDSAPLFFNLGTRWGKQGKAKFVAIQNEPALVRLNTVPTKKTGEKPIWTQEYVDKLIDQVKAINELQGTNFALPRLVQKDNPILAKYKNNPSMYNWMLNKLGAKPQEIYVEIPNIGLLKFKNGGKSKLIPRKYSITAK